MGFVDIRAETIRLFPQSAHLAPLFSQRPVLTPAPFSYVRLELERSGKSEALTYWRQAEEFYWASSTLSDTSSPLTSYYCMLNAAKALLSNQGQKYGASHGLVGESTSRIVSLGGEVVKQASGGVFPALVRLLGGVDVKGQTFTMRDLLSELPFVHRTFTLTYSSARELFIPLESPRFVRKEGSTEAWFTAYVPPSYTLRTLSLPKGYLRDAGVTKRYAIRRKKRFTWNQSDVPTSLIRLTTYHHSLRTDVVPIVAPTNRWYLRKRIQRGAAYGLPLLARMFAAMHRLSELSRYDPVRLERHLKARHNWLLNEFLSLAPAQFVHLIASELTGRDSCSQTPCA